jgi:hypothetical protein
LRALTANFRIACFLISWFSAISLVVWNSETNFIATFGTISFGIFLTLTVVLIKRQSFLIVAFLLILCILVSKQVPKSGDFLLAGKYILIFAGLIPSMGLVRSTARRLTSVQKSQTLLSRLPKDSFASGFQITAHFFGAVINTGVFAMLAAAMPPKSAANYRQAAAEAALRGMASSATWSPFFVAFVVGQVYLNAFSSWMGLAIGLIMGSTFSIISIFLLNEKINVKKIRTSLACLLPVFPTLIIIIILVVGSAIFFGLTALSAVIIVMPLLVMCYVVTKPSEFRPIAIETFHYLKTSTDDVVIISCAMLAGFFVTNSPETLEIFKNLPLFSIPDWSVLLFIPVTMATLSLIGIHPVISSTILLSVFTASNLNIYDPLMMQAHLLGWCTGTMSSIGSLSVITCSTLFQIPTSKLCFGINSYTTIAFAILGGVILAFINELIQM